MSDVLIDTNDLLHTNDLLRAYSDEDLVRAAEQCKQVQDELCHRYRPLIWKYAHQPLRGVSFEDMESYLWICFLEAVHNYDVEGAVPFAGFVKSTIHYGYYNYLKQMHRQWTHEIDWPLTASDDDRPALDTIPDTEDVADRAVRHVTKPVMHTQLCHAFQNLPADYQHLLTRAYRDGHNFATIGESTHTSRQAVQRKHQRALAALRRQIVGAH